MCAQFVVLTRLLSALLPNVSRYTTDLNDASDLSSQAPTLVYEYQEQTKQLRDNDKTTLYVDFQHVAKTKPALSDHIQLEYYRCVRCCCYCMT